MHRTNFVLRRFAVVPAAAAALASLLAVRPALAADDNLLATTKGSMLVRVCDISGEPVAGAGLHVAVWTSEDFRRNRDYSCDDAGTVRVELPKTLTILRMWAAKTGYCEMFFNVRANAQANEPIVPDEFTFCLPKGTVMGGVVKNEDGQGIKAVRVQLRYLSGGAQDDPRVRPSLNGFKLTDAEGRWKFENLPPGDDVQVSVQLSHPDYVSDYAIDSQSNKHVSQQVLRAQTAEIVMQRGSSLSGTVTDPDGKPIASALVVRGSTPWQSERKETTTDGKGAYRFGALRAKPENVTVVAEGWMPQTRKIDVGRQTGPVDFQLKAGKRLRVRLVDASGTPVPGANVRMHRWHGHESLSNQVRAGAVDPKIPRVADQDGVYEWTWAPDDEVTYQFYKPGFATTTASITADDSEHVQVMNKVLTVAGSVRDAVTGRTIDDFLVVGVIYFGPDFPFLERQNARRQKAGAFSMNFDRTDIEHGVQIEVPGYITYRSPGRLRVGEANPTLDVRLVPVEPYLGKVVDSAGKPVEKARVYVATGFQSLDLTNLKDRTEEFSSNYAVTTDENGAFEIAGQMERYALVAIAPGGYAEVDRAAGERPGEIHIQPWARLSGRLVQSGAGVGKHQVMLRPIRVIGGDAPRIHAYSQVMTDDHGEFIFERVPPTACHVHGYLHFSVDSPISSSRSMPLSLSPGEDARVTLGGGGVELTGQLVAEHQDSDFDYHFSISYLVARRPGIELPASLAGKGFDSSKGWSDSWRNSAEGQAFLDTLHNWFVKPAPDGRFRISGVEPGEYQFAVNLYGSTEGCLVHPIATRVFDVLVQEGQTTLELGKIMIPSHALAKVGDMATNFEFTELDGKKNSLAAFRGHYVLLDFWATWCGPCVAKIDDVERLRKQHEPGRLVVVGVNLDADLGRAREFLKSRSLPWHHALLGDWSDTEVPRRFAIANVPSYVLVGPDGKIVAHEYTLDAIARFLAEVEAPPK